MTAQYEPTWESLRRYTIPDWYLDAKFGIFIHWGVYSVPAFGNEWYPRNMYLKDQPEFKHHVETYGPQMRFGYKEFIPLFKAERFDPHQWMKIFSEAGARYVVPVAEHHDGFAMYASDLTPWNAARMGPGRDIIGELAEAARTQGLIFGVSNHRAEHWWFFNGGRFFESDVNDPLYESFYGPAVQIHPGIDWRSLDWQPRPDGKFLENWLARCCELVDKYQPQLFWFDWWIEQIVFEPYLQRFAAHYYNRGQEWNKGVAINYKNYSFPAEAAVWDIERGQLKGKRDLFWQTDTSISKNSWGYVKEQDYKSTGDIIRDLVDIVSKNGCMLLNVGPKPDGTIPEPEVEILRSIGKWLKLNGEAIYGTRPWIIYGEGPTEVPEGHFTDTRRAAYTQQDIRFTVKGNILFAALMDKPGKEVVIHSLSSHTEIQAEQIRTIRMLGCEEPLKWSQDEEGLKITLPDSPAGEHVFVIRIERAA